MTNFSPKDFLKARSPERFSDSVWEDTPELDRPLLEYHVETLTSKGQESNFERFARRLAQREICPNLLPQTGPTGGGDSRVDSETYPVADDLALAWYVGAATDAGSDRWAFAFSAKKDWRPKVRSDIAKIGDTGRGYVKAFFISSQYVPDRVRAQVEDELREKHGLDVRILDRSWILDRVFDGMHQKLAIEELGLPQSMEPRVRKGPLDVERERELGLIEARIKAASEQGNFGFEVVDDCIESSNLARSLELPRNEVEGRLVRSQKMAEKYGTRHQMLKSSYQMAWTAFWWFEDFELLVKQYVVVEGHAAGSQNPYDFELLSNLWSVIYPLVMNGEIDEGQFKLQDHTDALTRELERLAEDQERPTAALQARTLRLRMRLVSTAPHDVDPVLREVQDVVNQCQGMVGYPLEPLIEIVKELGEFIGDNPVYEELFNTTVDVASTREGEVTGARMLLNRGAQQLKADQPYEAIRSLGRVLTRLSKHESRKDLIRALYLCSNAYERVGLPWAALGTAVVASSVATNDFWAYGDVTPLQAACYHQARRLEVQLGRLPQTLAWHQVYCGVIGVLAEKGYDIEWHADAEFQFDAILGMRFLKADLAQLKSLSRLPNVLDNLGLQNSSLALLFALGHEVDSTPPCGEESAKEGKDDFYALWRDQPASEYLQRELLLAEDSTIIFNSMVLGCRITVEADNSSPCVILSESLLAALESLLATGIVDKLAAHEAVLNIRVTASSSGAEPFTYKMSDLDGNPYISVTCGAFDPHHVSPDLQGKLKDQIYALLVDVLARVILLQDPEQAIAKLFGDELALERSINFTSSFVTLGNVLGDTPRTIITDWDDPEFQDYPLLRPDVWDAADRQTMSESGRKTERPKLKLGEGEPPSELEDFSQSKHSQVETVSLIHLPLWNQAGWSGTAYAWAPGSPPILAFVFGDAEAGGQIFANWRKELGAYDVDEKLRITIIRGVRKSNPHEYRILLGIDPTFPDSRPDIKYAVITCRIHTMTPSSSHNLNTFLKSYESFGGYLLAHASAATETSNPEFIWDNRIAKRKLYVREAWEIERHDIDSAGILAEDDPIIPNGQEQAPVNELLRWKREHSPESPQDYSSDEARPLGRARGKQGRNEPCGCGSGRKYKRCCGR